MKTHI